ncbi:MAG: cyclic nucleotide-binding/CBS domain-containing protein [Thermodesulfobacteriota bacterium]
MPRKIANYIVKNVVTLDENKTAMDAAEKMTEEYIGSVVVTNAKGEASLFTERDLMMSVVGKGKDPSSVLLKDVVNKDTPTISPNERCRRCLNLMKEHRGRHLLVFDGGKFVGIVSLRDMVRLMIEEKESLIKELEKYITGAL